MEIRLQKNKKKVLPDRLLLFLSIQKDLKIKMLYFLEIIH